VVELGHAEPPDPAAPGMFALADPERLRELIEDAGFVEVVIDSVELQRDAPSVDAFIDETLDLSRPFADAREGVSGEQWSEVKQRIASLAEGFAAEDGALRLPASSLVAAAGA
jgi:hypothetical protein